jgi:hypothetical protein
MDAAEKTAWIVEPTGDRFADVVENVKLNESVTHVLSYVLDTAGKRCAGGGVQVQGCLRILEAMQKHTAKAIGGAIE